MGVESGGGGRVPRCRKISGGRPPRNYDISVSFFLTHVKILHFPTFSKKVAEMRGETKFWG